MNLTREESLEVKVGDVLVFNPKGLGDSSLKIYEGRGFIPGDRCKVIDKTEIEKDNYCFKVESQRSQRTDEYNYQYFTKNS